MIIFSALMIWKGLMVVTGSESPIVVVLSGSMEPAFYRGDLLFLTNYKSDPIRVGEILVFKVGCPCCRAVIGQAISSGSLRRAAPLAHLFPWQIEGRDIPIVHRVLKLHEKWVAVLAPL